MIGLGMKKKVNAWHFSEFVDGRWFEMLTKYMISSRNEVWYDLLPIDASSVQNTKRHLPRLQEELSWENRDHSYLISKKKSQYFITRNQYDPTNNIIELLQATSILEIMTYIQA